MALSRFLRRFPDYALTADPIRDGSARFRGFPHLPASVAALIYLAAGVEVDVEILPVGREYRRR